MLYLCLITYQLEDRLWQSSGGVHVFNSNKGYHGEKTECPECGRVYAPACVKSNFWFHIEFIPSIPYKSMYRKFCPVCGYGVEMKGKEGKAELKEKAEVTDQAFEPYVNHNLAEKPKGILTTDNSYEFHVKGSELRRRLLRCKEPY